MTYKRIIAAAAALSVCAAAFCQTGGFERRYDLLVSQLGPAGVGVETVLDNWEAEDSTDAKMLLGRFSYYFTKSQSAAVVTRPQSRYLGMEPMLSLKDSAGNAVNYFQVNEFDDEIFAKAVKAADRAIALWPDRLDFRFLKANAYIAYEKESPDMALSYLKALAAEGAARTLAWDYDGSEADRDFFAEAMQEYCYSFYSIGSPSSYEAFKSLSEQLVALFPEHMGFVNNIGSYYMVAKKDYKTALKYYAKVLKKRPDDYTAIKNGALAARKAGNRKLEIKYLLLLAEHGTDSERTAAKVRAEALSAGR